MLYAKIIAKGSPADVAAAAAIHGLAIQGSTHAGISGDEQPTLGTFVGECYPNREGIDPLVFERRVQAWFHEELGDSPYPAGTLLYFTIGGAK